MGLSKVWVALFFWAGYKKDELQCVEGLHWGPSGLRAQDLSQVAGTGPLMEGSGQNVLVLRFIQKALIA